MATYHPSKTILSYLDPSSSIIEKSGQARGKPKVKAIEGFDQFTQGKMVVRCNPITGCENNCQYCHQRYRNRVRFKDPSPWNEMRINEKKIHNYRNRIGCVLQCPTTSDLFPKTLPYYERVIENGIRGRFDEIQITSKPRVSCIEPLTTKFGQFHHTLHFFFTITTDRNGIIRTWEGRSPMYEERIECLRLAFGRGFRTSVIMEPLLSDPRNFIQKYSGYVTDRIYIGKMNYITQLMNTPYNRDLTDQFDELKRYYKTLLPELAFDKDLLTNTKVVWKK